jgi:hypothetical protein
VLPQLDPRLRGEGSSPEEIMIISKSMKNFRILRACRFELQDSSKSGVEGISCGARPAKAFGYGEARIRGRWARVVALYLSGDA